MLRVSRPTVTRILSTVIGGFAGVSFVSWLILTFSAVRMEALASIMVATQGRLMANEVRVVLSHLASIPAVRALREDSCKAMVSDFVESKGLFAVLAIGDAEGNPICTADPSSRAPLPSMSDRLYYQRVRESDGLVVGEYTTSKTTGKPVLHFAYPIRDEQGAFRGLVLAAIDLLWFSSSDVDKQFMANHVQVMGVDQNGKLLYSYPAMTAELGKNLVTPTMVAELLSGRRTHAVLRGSDGIYRMYAYRYLSSEPGETAIVASVSLVQYWWLWTVALTVSTFVGASIGMLLTRKGDRKR